MADPFETAGCAKEAGNDKRKHRRSRGGGGLANHCDSAAALHAAFANLSHGLPPKIFFVAISNTHATEEASLATTLGMIPMTPGVYGARTRNLRRDRAAL